MIKLYFDGKEVEKDYYRSLTQSFILFDKSFYLGSVPSNTFRIELNNKANINSFNEVKIKLDDEDYAHVYYDNLETSNSSKNIIPLSDAMVDFEFNYDASPLIENSSTGYVTILEILEDICSIKGITLATKNFNLKDKHITWYDSTISARKYISYIATLNGGFAKISRNGELELVRYSNEIKAEIDTCKDYKIGEHHKITRVVWDIGTDIWEYGDKTGDTLYLDTDNPFITEKEDIQSIYNLIKDFEFYSMEISKCPIDSNIEIGDVIAFRKDDKLYPFIAQLEYSYNGGFRGGYKTILNTKKVEETSVNDIQKNIKSIKTKLNRDEASLKVLAEESNATQKNVGALELESKRIALEVSKKVNDKDLTGANLLLRINEDDTSEVKMNADKLKLEGYTTINEGFGVDLEGKAFMNGASIKGGNIELIDTGSNKTKPCLILYDENNVIKTKTDISEGIDMSSETLYFAFPDSLSGPIGYENLIIFENGFIKYSNTSKGLNIFFRNGTNTSPLYDSSTDTLLYNPINSINLTELKLPSNIGEITYLNDYTSDETSDVLLCNYITYIVKTLKIKTEYGSNGIKAVNGENYCEYNPQGFYIKDERGIREFSSDGIKWMTPYGQDYVDFVVNKDNVLYGEYFLVKGKDIEKLTIIDGSKKYLEVLTVNGAFGVDIWASDKRLKKNISDSEYNALDLIKKIKHRKFKYKDTNKEIAIGYIADELQELDEDLVFEVGEKKLKQPNTSYIIPIFSKAFQEQQSQIEELKKEIENLKKEVTKK